MTSRRSRTNGRSPSQPTARLKGKKKPKIIVDFNTKFIGPEKQVWSIFPGREYKFFNHFIKEGVVFGDFPGLLIRDFDINNNDDLRRWLALSDRVRGFYTGKKSPEDEPSRDPADYKRSKWTGARSNAKGIVHGLYARAKKGDLVLVTSRGGAWGITHVGEFIDPPEAIIYENFHGYRREKLPARRVKWLGKIDNRSISEELWKNLTSPNAFSQVGRSHFNFVFERAYGNFIRTDLANSMFSIKAEKFSTVPDMYLKIIANYAGGIVKSIEEGSEDEFFETSFADWLLDLEDSVYYANQKIYVSSPGKNLLHSIKITPILAVVLFAVCQLPAEQIKAADIMFTNSAAGDTLDDCDIPVMENAKIAFDKMSLDHLEKICRASTKAGKLGGIQTPMKVKVQDDG